MASEEMIFEYFFRKFRFRLPWQPIQFSGLNKIHRFGRGLPKEHLCKIFVKIFKTAINANFHFSHYRSMVTVSCHSNQSSYPIGIKKHNYSFPRPIDAIGEIWQESASWFQRRCCFKMLMTDRRRMPTYPIIAFMSLRLRRANNREKGILWKYREQAGLE